MKSPLIGLASLVGAAVTLSAQVGPPAVAQTGSNSASTSPVCMTKARTDGGELAIVLPEKDVGAMEAKGFVLVSCGEKFGSQARLEAYRDSICTISSSLSEEQQQKFEEVRGERPSALCGMAEVTIGQWVRKGRS